MCLEFSKIDNEALNFLYKNYSKIIPLAGKYIVGSSKPYDYLVESIDSFYNQKQLFELMIKNGFSNVEYRNLIKWNFSNTFWLENLMLKRVFKLFQIARRLSTSGAVDIINQVHQIPLSINLFFSFISIGTENNQFENNQKPGEKLCLKLYKVWGLLL